VKALGHIIAVDPGAVTGVAEWSQDLGIIQSYEVEGCAEGFFDEWSWENVEAVVCESFTITPATLRNTRKGSKCAIDIIGWLKGECAVRRIPFIAQSPAQAKRFGSNAKLKHLNAHKTTDGGHANDAVRHLITYLADTKHPVMLERLKGMLDAQDHDHPVQHLSVDSEAA
jgi:hypothetical protein